MADQVEFFFEPRLEEGRGGWSAFCDVLGMASCGDTEQEAIHNLQATLQALGRALQKRGILLETLEDAGLRWNAVEVEGCRVII